MSHTNSTTNYSLPQFLTTDKPAWLTDVNNAYLAIDTAMKNNADAASTADTKATNAGSAATTADTKATAAKSTAEGAVSSISDVFSDTAQYSVGDIVIYNNLLYICTVAVTTPGAWTGSANWARTTIESLINTINSTLSNKQDTIPNTVAKTIVNDVNPSGGEIRAKFYNRVLYVSGYVQYSSLQSASTQLLHIEDVTLAMEVYETAVTSNNASVRTKLTTDGKLVLESSLPANSWISVTFAALIA